MVRSMDGSDAELLPVGQGAYSNGFVVFPRGETLYAQRFDLVGRRVTAQPRSLGLPVVRAGGRARFSVNHAGTLLVLSAATSSRTQFSWFDRRGGRGANVGPEGEYGAFDLTSRSDRVVVGGAGTYAATRLLKAFLYGVTERDPWTLGVAGLVLVTITAVACSLAARRAARIEPYAAIRYE